MKKIAYLLMLILLLPLLSCSNSQGKSLEGLNITGFSAAIGSTDDNLNIDIQRYSYTFIIQNNTSNEFYVEWVKPVLSETFSSKVLNNDLKVMVDKTISPNTNIAISGEFRFNAKGLSKQDISDMTTSQPASMQISTTSILSLSSHS